MNLKEVLARADDESLEHIVGKPVVRLLNLLDPTLARPSSLRSLVTEFRTGPELLTDPRTRAILIDLLEGSQAVALANQFGLDQASPYDALRGHSFSRRGEREELLAWFGIVDELEEEEVEQHATSARVLPVYGLFDHQRVAAAQTELVLARPGHRVVLHMPTGSGKTRTAMHIIANHFRNLGRTSVVWLAYSEELCEQAATEFEAAWSYLGDRELTINRFWGLHTLDVSTVEDSFVVAGLQKMYSLAKTGDDELLRLADRSSLVVLDEAHQATAATYRLTLELLVDRHESTRLLGLTATPGRTWNDVDEDEKLSGFFNERKVSLEVPGYDNPIDYLVDEGYLARASFESIMHQGTSLSDDETVQIAESLDIPEAILRKLGDDEQRNLAIIDKVEQLIHQHERIIVFAPSVASARLMSTVLHARGADANVVTGSTPKADRARLIARFKSNTPGSKVLVNYGVLTTGFDAPRTSAVVIARPTKSLVLYSQMVGRATRGERAGGNATAMVVTVVDRSLPGFGEMSESFKNWEDVWKP